MPRISTKFQICVSLVSITLSSLMLARLVGFIPNEAVWGAQSRARLVHTVAAQASLAAKRHDTSLVKQQLQAALELVPGLLACKLETPAGVISVGDFNGDSREFLDIPILLGNNTKGSLRFQFQPCAVTGLAGTLSLPFVKLTLFMSSVQLILSWLYLRRVLTYLDPSRVLPERVRSTLDSLAEGLIVVDNDERIVLANEAFSKTLGRSFNELLGHKPSELSWRQTRTDQETAWPWLESLEKGKSSVGSVLRLGDESGGTRTFRVNSVPLLDDQGNCNGAMASFDDVTSLEARTAALTKMLAKLKNSRDQIRRQNRQLHLLATRDPLTSALNRRSFFEHLERLWNQSREQGWTLSCLMLDVDHFKQINDQHGHASGDMVLKSMVNVLHRCVRHSDIVCRYGGEEFCVLLPNTPPEAAAASAERFRHEVAAADFEGLKITASFGVVSTGLGAESTQQLMDQADEALYAAKRSGRNRVVRWDRIPHVDTKPDDFLGRETPAEETQTETPISFQIVTALTSALAYRDAATAEHSRRVADLCVLVARDLLPLSDCYILENAAMLHDIGKIGVPDSILLKPGPLADDEWSIMRSHDEIGVEIIRSTFACDALTEIVMYHHTYYGGGKDDKGHPAGDDIPLGARILTIADAYDAMVTDRVYRRGFSQEKAFSELRRCAPKQFDPILVERFISIVGDRKSVPALDTTSLSKTAALKLGVQIENLSRAVDNNDISELRSLAQCIRDTAQEFEIPEVEQLAVELSKLLRQDHSRTDLMQVVQLTVDLMELCRQTQRAHLTTQAQPTFCRLATMSL